MLFFAASRMSDANAGGRRIAVITVHGTGDTAERASGQKWFQNGSEFAAGLQGRLGARGLKADIYPHIWPGANSSTERENAARSLAKLIRSLAQDYEGVHVIAHSHGGNVANDAACMLNWKQKNKRPKLASVTTVGTPFFRTQATRTEALGAWAFGAVVIISLLWLILLPILSLQFWDEWQSGERLFFFMFLAADSASLVTLVFIFPLVFRALTRIGRAGRRARQDTAIFAIRHPEDEAIAFLRAVETMPIEPFPPGAVLRGSRTGAIVWGTRAVLTALLICVLLAIAASFDSNTLALLYLFPARLLQYFFGLTPTQDFLGSLSMFVLAATPLIFGLVYLGYRLAAGTAGELAFRSRLNALVGGALRGLAFGRDGDNRIGDVSPLSHYYATLSFVLSGEVAARMTAFAKDASRRLFEKYRRGVFSVHADQNKVLHEIANDALTWDSLVHTIYFDQPEVLALCSRYICGVALGGDAVGSTTLVSSGATLEPAPTRRRRKFWVPLLAGAATAALIIAVAIGGLPHLPRVLNRDALVPSYDHVLPPSYAPGSVLRDCDQCPELVVVGGGGFVMGSPSTQTIHQFDEGPLRWVSIAPFAVGRYEVTFAQWDACVAGGGCRAYRPSGQGWGRGNRPVINVNWNDAQAYVQWLSQRTGQRYRLLTEAEWEYAARAGTTAKFWWGDQDPVCDQGARNGAQSNNCDPHQTLPVGLFQPNGFGLYDMHGNVNEWVQDCYAVSYSGLPTDGSAFEETSCSLRVLRGGAWDSPPIGLRSAHRDSLVPADRWGGFRVARTL